MVLTGSYVRLIEWLLGLELQLVIRFNIRHRTVFRKMILVDKDILYMIADQRNGAVITISAIRRIFEPKAISDGKLWTSNMPASKGDGAVEKLNFMLLAETNRNAIGLFLFPLYSKKYRNSKNYRED
jgi:hypothetical protein